MTPAYFDGFGRRNRTALVAILDRQLAARAIRTPTVSRSTSDRYAEVYAQPPDMWAASQRTAANLAAMRLAARKRPEEMTARDPATLVVYSGWGGVSIQAVASQFPTGLPVPEERGLIHEYYMPTKVAREVGRMIRPLVPKLPQAGGVLLALEPTSGMARRVFTAGGPGLEDL